MELILLLIEGFNDRLKGFVIKSNVAWPRVKTVAVSYVSSVRDVRKFCPFALQST